MLNSRKFMYEEEFRHARIYMGFGAFRFFILNLCLLHILFIF